MTKEEMQKVLTDPYLPSSAIILWIRLYLEQEYQPFSHLYEELSEKLELNSNTTKHTFRLLFRRGAIGISPQYNQKGRIGSQFCLINPAKWAKFPQLKKKA
jgi:hypothetical protein